MNKINLDPIPAMLVAAFAVILALVVMVDARSRQEGYRQGAIKTCLDNALKGCDVKDLESKFYNEDNK